MIPLIKTISPAVEFLDYRYGQHDLMLSESVQCLGVVDQYTCVKDENLLYGSFSFSMVDRLARDVKGLRC